MDEDLDGIYIFKSNFPATIPGVCNSNCIYSRLGPEYVGLEYCFQDISPQQGTIIDECEAHPTIGKNFYCSWRRIMPVVI